MGYTKIGLGTAAAVTTLLVAGAKREAIANGIRYAGADRLSKQLHNDVYERMIGTKEADSVIGAKAVSKERLEDVLKRYLNEDLMKKHDVSKDHALTSYFGDKLTKKPISLAEMNAAIGSFKTPDQCQETFGCTASQFRQIKNGLVEELRKVSQEHTQNLILTRDEAHKLIKVDPAKYGAPRREDGHVEYLDKVFGTHTEIKLSKLLAYAKENGNGRKFTSWFDTMCEWAPVKSFHKLSDDFFHFFFRDTSGRNLVKRTWDNMKEWCNKPKAD